MNPAELVTTEAAQKGFYPTPPSVAGKMLAGIDFRYISTVLEPSAGKGDLVEALLRANGSYRHIDIDVDVIEIDPYLRQILKYNYVEKGRGLPEGKMVRIVHDDFLTYRTYKRYSLILMNPPFANGDLHLLHAIELQADGGKIVCLLNAETLRNPYTVTRQFLMRRLNELGAQVTFLDDAFSSDAERKAKVDVAIVRIDIPEPRRESKFYERMKQAVDREPEDEELNALIPGGFLEQLVHLYKAEVAATMEFIREYRALGPFMQKDFSEDGKQCGGSILKLVVDNDSTYYSFDYQKYMRMVRMKYWQALFSNKQFTGKLTSELQKRYRAEVEKMADYEFSLFNINQIALDMAAAMQNGVEKAILDLFEKLTVDHTWYPECSVNRHYFNGWKTNKAHKIGKKCIIPTSGMFSSYSWEHETFNVSTAYEVISDIEKALDYLDGGRTDECDLEARLKVAESGGVTRNISCKYFKIDLFKKGTTHIKFHPEAMELVDRLNIYASRKKGWLPPNYGKTAYSNMDAEERAVVDNFHGDGSEGSGREAYGMVLQNAAFYLADPTRAMPALMAPANE